MQQLSFELTATTDVLQIASSTPQRLRVAGAALRRGDPLLQVLHALYGEVPGVPADDVVALVRRVAASLPARPRRPLLQQLCASTSAQAGRVFFRAPDAIPQLARLLEPHRARVLAAWDARQDATPAGDELVMVRDCYGSVHRVLRADLDDPDVVLLPCYRRDGAPVAGDQGRLHRDNIDPDGSKASEAWKNLPYIAAKGDRPFKSERSAHAAIRRLRQDPARYTLLPIAGGVVAVLAENAPAASAIEGETPPAP